MNRLPLFLALALVSSPVAAQRHLDKVVIPPATIVIAPTPFQPGDAVNIEVSFRQGLAFAPIEGLGCSGPTDTSATPCDGARTLGVSLWYDDAAGVRKPQPLGGAGADFTPPPFYTLVTRTFQQVSIPAVEPSAFLTIELVFVDKFVKVNGGIGLSVVEVPRVLGMRRFKWSCGAGKAARCAYVEASD